MANENNAKAKTHVKLRRAALGLLAALASNRKRLPL